MRVCVGRGLQREGRGGPKGEEDALAFFVGLFSSLFKKKNNNNLLPSHLHRFSASWDRRRRPGGKAKPSGEGTGSGAARESHAKAGSKAGGFWVALLPQREGQSNTSGSPLMQNPLAASSGSP